jgi:hypothetical protein
LDSLAPLPLPLPLQQQQQQQTTCPQVHPAALGPLVALLASRLARVAYSSSPSQPEGRVAAAASSTPIGTQHRRRAPATTQPAWAR